MFSSRAFKHIAAVHVFCSLSMSDVVDDGRVPPRSSGWHSSFPPRGRDEGCDEGDDNISTRGGCL